MICRSPNKLDYNDLKESEGEMKNKQIYELVVKEMMQKEDNNAVLPYCR